MAVELVAAVEARAISAGCSGYWTVAGLRNIALKVTPKALAAWGCQASGASLPSGPAVTATGTGAGSTSR